jgi:hypothetical protein
MLHAIVHRADIQDRDGGGLVMATLFGRFPFLTKLFADGGYQGPIFTKAAARAMPDLSVEIVKRSDAVSGFAVLPKRWVVERSFAWFGRCRRLAKDFENFNRTALAFLGLASIGNVIFALPTAPGVVSEANREAASLRFGTCWGGLSDESARSIAHAQSLF